MLNSEGREFHKLFCATIIVFAEFLGNLHFFAEFIFAKKEKFREKFCENFRISSRKFLFAGNPNLSAPYII